MTPTIYHVPTQADYDALMIELEEKGVRWVCHEKPTELNFWTDFKCYTCLFVRKEGMTFCERQYFEDCYPQVPLIEYKAPRTEELE